MKKFSFILTLIVALAVTAHAQLTTLTMQDAINVAMQNNRDLESSRLAIENSDAQVKEAFSSALPSLAFNAGYQYNLKKQVFYITGQDGLPHPNSIGGTNAVSTDLTLTQVLFNSAVFTGVGTAETYAKVSRQQLRSKTSDVILNVKRAYYTALLAKEVLQVNQTLLQNASENLKNTEALYKAGLRAEFDAIRAQVQYANQQPVVVQATNNYDLAIDNLKLLLGYDDTKKIELSESLARPVSTEQSEPGVDEAKRILEEYNPMLQSLRLSTDVNKDLIKIKESDYLPTVSFIGKYQYAAQADKFTDLSFQPTSFVGLNLSLNLFNGYRTNAQVEEARITYEQSKFNLDQVTNALKTQLESVLRRIDYARQRISVGDQTINQAQRGYTIATASYKAGTGTQLQINDADLALAQARLNQLNAVYDYDVALAELEQLLGQRYTVTPDNKNVQYSSR